MAFTNGMELANNTLAFAEHQNHQFMGARGNQVVSGVGVTAQGTPDLTVAVASGTVLAGGVVVAVSADATFAGTPNTFATTQGNLTSGQAEFVFVHIDSSGVITNTEGGAAVAGQQLPPDVPEDEVIIAMITLTEGDTTIDSVDIEDWRVNVPKGAYIAGGARITDLLDIRKSAAGEFIALQLQNLNTDTGVQSSVSLDFIHGDSLVVSGKIKVEEIDVADARSNMVFFTNSSAGPATEKLRIDNAGKIYNRIDDTGFHVGASDQFRFYFTGTNAVLKTTSGDLFISNTDSSGNIIIELKDVFQIVDNDDGNAVLFALDTNLSGGRTLTIGASSDPIASTFNGAINLTGASGTTKLTLTNSEADEASITLTTPTGTAIIVGAGAAGEGLVGSVAGDFVITNRTGESIIFSADAGITQHQLIITEPGLIKNQVDSAGFHTGEADDFRLYFDGADAIIDVSFAGSDLKLRPQTEVTIGQSGDTVNTRIYGNLTIDTASNGLISLLNNAVRDFRLQASSSSDYQFVFSNTSSGAMNVKLASDNDLLIFGTGGDAIISYTGSHLNIIADNVGSGNVNMPTALGLTTHGGAYTYALTIGTAAAEAIGVDEAIAEAWNLHSSIRWKENFRIIENPLDIINKLNPLIYDLKEASKPKHYNKIGFVAEELGKVLPELVNWEDEPSSDGTIYATGIDYARLTALNMAAIQELHKIIKELR